MLPLHLKGVLTLAALLGSMPAAAHVIPVSALAPTLESAVVLVGSFQGTIPTEASPLRGAARLAKMRREGRLPDTFVRGGCRYNLAGDPAVAYYVKECAGRR
jgi:hypothetical protein